MSGMDVAIIALQEAGGVLPSVKQALTSFANVRDYWPTTSTDADVPQAAAFILVAGSALHGTVEEWLKRLRRLRPSAARMVIAFTEQEQAPLQPQLEGWLQAGATDFIFTPFCSAELQTRLTRALNVTPAEPSISRSTPEAFKNLIGRSERFSRDLNHLAAITACDAGVLLLGETGTGKEVCAQAIHYASARSRGPWVAVNCGAIPLELIEDELFGHVRGAYTHAHTAREGLISEAEDGTLFLDEIDSLPLAAQSKLLRFLEDKKYRPVGGNTQRQANVRVIAASNRCLSQLVERGQFREDLYFRLNILSLTLPPLRERLEDIPLLAQHFASLAATSAGLESCRLSYKAQMRLAEHAWPGNVRELKHFIERTVLLTRQAIIAAEYLDLPTKNNQPEQEESLRAAKARVIENFERCYLERLLVGCQGNISHSARVAKKNRRALFELLRKHQIDAQQYRAKISA